MSSTLSYLSAGLRVREERRRASMSDPSESWVNNPGLFAVLPLPLALVLIFTQMHARTQTRRHKYTNNTFCHCFQSPPHCRSPSSPSSPSTCLHLPLCLCSFMCHLGPTKKEKGRKSADFLKALTD